MWGVAAVAISFACLSCKRTLVVSAAAAAGRKGKCPHCKGAIEVPANDTESVADVLPAELPTDETGKFYVAICHHCKRKNRVHRSDAERVGRCIGCQFCFQLVINPQLYPQNIGLPIRLKIAGEAWKRPDRCACCFGQPDTFRQKIPYCHECNDHVLTGQSDGKKHACIITSAAALHEGSYRSVHSWAFYNWKFANEVMFLNPDKLRW